MSAILHAKVQLEQGVIRYHRGAHMARGAWWGGRMRAASAMAPNRSAKLTRVAVPEPGRGNEPRMDPFCPMGKGVLAKLGSCRTCNAPHC